MNMADCEDDYSSSDDSDYVPGKEGASDSEPGEEDLEGTDQNESKDKGKKIKKDAVINRKRKGGIKLEGESDVNGDQVDEEEERRELEEERKALEEEKSKAEQEEREEKEKQRADNLWKSLLSDVGPRPKATTSKIIDPKPKTEDSVSKDKKEKTEDPPPKPEGDEGTSIKETIMVTEVFDFAGEEIKVSKEVKVNSQEANKNPAEGPSTKSIASQLPIGKRKPGGLGSILGKMNKKPKISVLDKSKLDWDSFKTKEGIAEDLRIHNKGKDGFLQKQDFLKDTDLRQYEVERKLRMGQSGK